MRGKIFVVGLGFGDEQSLPLGTLNLLETGERVWLRTEKHPVVSWLKQKGIDFRSFDRVYEAHDEFSAVYRAIAEKLFDMARTSSPVIYAVPGHPMVAEKTVRILLAEGPERGIKIEVRGGGSFLDASFARLEIDPIEGFQLVDGNELDPEQINPRVHVLVGQVYDRLVASDVKLALMETYPDEHRVQIATALGVEGLEQIKTVPLFELDRTDDFTDLTSVYVPPLKDGKGLYRRFDFLTGIIEHLRSPEGCPWDRKQTHESLRPYLIEEAYEFLDAVAGQDAEGMADELGDVLLQVMLHAQIAKEEGTFDIYEVIGRLSDKMIRRHPHVFGDQAAETAEDVKRNWEQIKKQERSGEEMKSLLDGIPNHLPALLKSYELQKKAAKAGFDWEKKEDVLRKVHEELKELIEADTAEEQEEELGDLLFVLGSLARFFNVHPELALLGACRKFECRFRYIEKQAQQLGKQLEDLTMEQLDAWWDEAKQSEG
ncbi:nucleoside triphosphate pyrophosphohydrolase [Paenactinomyces guangxiensis]|uniref:Nucleoside triphosphate pyrophosphohydrolase n=1 Tax=Paenactinomyces guangxiensis TaxID=1490290 RepID=A0A7W2AAE8_9BACL|nr:nucleoside triphosphate pyrophosphohydrolase [Paenactinomyces guangxiensis]MBA4495813.1 nucleoside triphosphate pyrophosphohydrolase [Paenactinomyces guangxiensis]MBH8592903.1 nucleoside triphosphate pyrophosphohydrolase [Paenactinomyces guangxiensis]